MRIRPPPGVAGVGSAGVAPLPPWGSDPFPIPREVFVLNPIKWWRGKRNEPYRAVGSVPPPWAGQPTMLFEPVGRAGCLTPAQQWRANGGRW
jgi:hypothetical protein